jgi:hypothetical protein
VKHFSQRGSDSFDVERELSSNRPAARPELARTIVARINKEGRPFRVGSLRLGFAAGLTAAMLLALAGFGGLGDIASAAKGTASTIQQVMNSPEPSSVNSRGSGNSRDEANSPGGSNSGDVGLSSSASANQYGNSVVICHRPPGNPDNRHTLIVGESAVAAHLAHGDTIGACG